MWLVSGTIFLSVDERHHRGEILRAAHRGAQDGKLFPKHAPHREFRRVARRRAEERDSSAGRGEFDQLVETFAARAVDGHVEAAARLFFQGVGPFVGLVADAARRAEFDRLRDLRVRTACHKHRGTRRHRESAARIAPRLHRRP